MKPCGPEQSRGHDVTELRLVDSSHQVRCEDILAPHALAASMMLHHHLSTLPLQASPILACTCRVFVVPGVSCCKSPRYCILWGQTYRHQYWRLCVVLLMFTRKLSHLRGPLNWLHS